MALLLVVRPPFSFVLLFFATACSSHPGSVTQRIEDVETKNVLSETEQVRASTASYEQASGFSELMSQKTSTLLSEALHMLRRVKDVRERRWLEAYIHRLGSLAADLERDGRREPTFGPPHNAATPCVQKSCKANPPKPIKSNVRDENEVKAPERVLRPQAANRKVNFDEEDELVQQLHSSHNQEAKPAPTGKITVKVWSQMMYPPTPLSSTHPDATSKPVSEYRAHIKDLTVNNQKGKANQILDVSKRTKEGENYSAAARELKSPDGTTTSLPSQMSSDQTTSAIRSISDDELVRQLQEEKLLLVSTRGPDLARLLLPHLRTAASCFPTCEFLGNIYEKPLSENGK